MKKSILIFLLILATIAVAFSQESYTQNIRGTVVDATTGYPLIGANIILLNTQPPVGATTDLDGNFQITGIGLGRQAIEISYIGYKPQVLNNLLVGSAKELVLNVQLEENAVSMEEVVVKAGKRKDRAQNDMAMISARTFSVEETERFAGSLGDPARMVANYAGVMTQNDARNDIIIRGNSPSGVLWRMEGIEIPNPNHFGALGTTGGPVSMVNNNLLTNSDFITGAFPAEYGNALAGAFDLNLRSGNNTTTEFVGQVGFNGFELGAEGPIFGKDNKVRPSYLANFRYSTMEVMDMLGLSSGTGAAIPEYKDFTLMVDVPGTKYGRFKLFGLWGESFIGLGRDLSDSTGNAYNTRGSATDFGSRLSVLGLSHTYFFTKNIRVKSSLSAQSIASNAIVDSIDYESNSFKRYYAGEDREDKFTIATQVKHKLNSKNNYSIGATADFFAINYHDSVFDYDYNQFIQPSNINNNMEMLRVYAQWQHNFTNNLTGYLGVHSQYFLLNNELAIEPRAAIRWQFTPKQSVSFGYGKHSQTQPKAVYFVRTFDTLANLYHRTNENLEYTKSDHYVFGYNYVFSNTARIKAEAYYQHLYDVPVKEGFPEFSMLNTGADFGGPMEDSLINEGVGRNYGLELTIEKFLSKGYYVLFTASLFDSKYKGYDKQWRNTAFNGNYVINVLGGYEHKLGKHGVITIDLKTVWAGGKRYVPVDFEASAAKGEAVYDWSNAFQDKYDDYFRTDVRLGYRINNKSTSMEWAIDFQNIFNYQSIYSEAYDPKANEVYFTYQQGFIPMFLFRINF
jgi:hypothetical protein